MTWLPGTAYAGVRVRLRQIAGTSWGTAAAANSTSPALVRPAPVDRALYIIEPDRGRTGSAMASRSLAIIQSVRNGPSGSERA